jgi:AcrR family transcriptional regulator
MMTSLSAEKIAEAALELVDREGLDALSMRKLGAALGVDAKAIYYYYPNKDALIEGVLRAAFADMPDNEGGTWQEQLRQIARAYYDLMRQHPHLQPYFLRFDGSIPVVFAVVEQVAAVLSPTGLTPRSIIQIIDLLTAFVPTVESNEGVYEQLMALPDETYPAAKNVIRQITADDLEEDFEFQLNLILMGIEAQIRRDHSPS